MFTPRTVPIRQGHPDQGDEADIQQRPNRLDSGQEGFQDVDSRKNSMAVWLERSVVVVTIVGNSQHPSGS